MSRAFVKEVDEVPLPPILERPVSPAGKLVTRRGARLIEQAIAALEERIAATSDEKVVPALRRDLLYWSARQSNMQIMPSVEAPISVAFGVRATIRVQGAQAGETVDIEAGGRVDPVTVVAVAGSGV